MNQKTPDAIVEYDVPAKMRDRAALQAHIYRPSIEGKFPVLLQITSSNKIHIPFVLLTVDPLKVPRAGYIVIFRVPGKW